MMPKAIVLTNIYEISWYQTFWNGGDIGFEGLNLRFKSFTPPPFLEKETDAQIFMILPKCNVAYVIYKM